MLERVGEARALFKLATQTTNFLFEIRLNDLDCRRSRSRRLTLAVGLRFRDLCRSIRRCRVKTICRSFDTLSKLIEPLRFGKDHVCKRLVRRKTLQIAAAKTFDQLPVVNTLRKRAATNDRELSFAAADLDRSGKAVQSRMALIFDSAAGLDRFRVCDATVRVAEFHMVR